VVRFLATKHNVSAQTLPLNEKNVRMKTARELFPAKELASVPSRIHSLERVVDYGRRERLLLALARLGTHVVGRAADSSALVPTAKA